MTLPPKTSPVPMLVFRGTGLVKGGTRNGHSKKSLIERVFVARKVKELPIPAHRAVVSAS